MSAPNCPICNKVVYFADPKRTEGKKTYHQSCWKKNASSGPKFQSLPAAGQQADVTYTSPATKEEPVKKGDAAPAAEPAAEAPAEGGQ